MNDKEAFEAWYYEIENYSLRAERMAMSYDEARAAFEAGWQEATKQERERCAKVCEGLVWALDFGGNAYVRPAGAIDCAAAIRKG